jgi:large subunit ribosomal protein L10
MMKRTRPVPQKKLDEIAHLKKMVNSYQVVGLANLSKMPASALQDLRVGLRKDVVIHVAKKRLIKFAFEELKKPGLDQLLASMKGITALLFTNMNPMKLAKYLESKKAKGPAKGGDIAPYDIVVPEGDTKFPPGPIVSELSQNLKVQTMVKNGTVHIRADVTTHPKGTVIKQKEAELLTKLGIVPMEIKLDFYTAWENGQIIPNEVLHVNEELLLNNFRLGASQALGLAMGMNLVIPETIKPIMTKAIRAANAVAIKSGVFIPELAQLYLSTAVREASAVEASVFGASEGTSSKEEKKPEKKKTEEPKEEPETTGLGGLFE